MIIWTSKRVHMRIIKFNCHLLPILQFGFKMFLSRLTFRDKIVIDIRLSTAEFQGYCNTETKPMSFPCVILAKEKHVFDPHAPVRIKYTPQCKNEHSG